MIIIDDSLLLRYFAKDVSAEEEAIVREWMAASEKNAKQAREVYNLYYATEMLNVKQQVSVEEALKKVHKRIHSPFKLFFSYFRQAAAILIIPVVIALAYVLMKDNRNVKTEDLVEIRTAPGMLGSVDLPDGTKVWLNSNSSVQYPVHFKKDIREVSIKGEAFFDVAKNKKKLFIVHTPQKQVSIEVYGTKFNIDAYPETDFITTTLVSGSIGMYYIDAKNQILSKKMQPNKQIVYNKVNRDANFHDTYVKKDIAWKDGQIILRDTPLKDALWIISKRFDVDFHIENPLIYSYSFTGTFSDQHLERILEHFRLSSNIKYIIEQKVNKDGYVQKKQVFLR